MAYSELIKNFAKIREYMSQFYVYGFKSRSEYTAKSARSYDNERRRIESWLGEYMSFNQTADGKNVFIAVDSRNIPSNPLYNTFKAKSFTSNDIMLHFCILDILTDYEELTAGRLADILSNEYLKMFDCNDMPDESTVRKKLREYTRLGLLKSRKQGNQLLFSRNESDVDLKNWKNAVTFFSEEAPLGVVGSFLLDKYDEMPDFFSFKHHYILHTLESEILCSLLYAISDGLTAVIETFSPKTRKMNTHSVIPLKIRVSTQSGRQYLMCWNILLRRMTLLRLDNIKNVTLGEKINDLETYREYAENFSQKLWGAASNGNRTCDHVEMTIYVGDKEEYIIHRLEREKRNGKIKKIDEHQYKFVADVYDACEMIPWIRTFIGRILKLESTNAQMLETFNSDLKSLKEMYGGEEDAF